MKPLLVLVALLSVNCGGTSTVPTSVPPPPPSPPPSPVPVPMITVVGCPDTVVGVDVAFYREIGCNAFDLPLQAVRRWAVAPHLYLRTVDEAGAAIDAVTLDTVQDAMSTTASAWTSGRFGLADVTRGTDSREGVSGWITVKWPATDARAPACGRSQVAVDGGWIELNYRVTSCACTGSAIRPRTARHELGHALGYWHTDSPGDLMSGLQVAGCDASPSARELLAAAYQYR